MSLVDRPIHVWTPLSPGQPCLAMTDGLPGILARGATALKAKARMRDLLEAEQAKIDARVAKRKAS